MDIVLCDLTEEVFSFFIEADTYSWFSSNLIYRGLRKCEVGPVKDSSIVSFCNDPFLPISYKYFLDGVGSNSLIFLQYSKESKSFDIVCEVKTTKICRDVSSTKYWWNFSSC